jgi:benzoate membrane transport protein
VTSAAIVAAVVGIAGPLLKAIAGLGLLGALAGALGQALGEQRLGVPAVLTFAVAASGVVALGIGAAFWGLVAGLLALGLERAVKRP